MANRVAPIIGRLIIRVYTFAIMAVVLWAGYAAVEYLYRTVFKPARSPEQVLAWQGQTRAEALREEQVMGISEPARRSPIGHYHGVDRWFQPDLRNGCITSGCHDPIPHSKNKALRAFANLHSTFTNCEVCHRTAEKTPLPVVWVDTRTGTKRAPPAILQLIGQFSATTRPAEDLAGSSANIVALLREAIDGIGGDPILNYLATRLDTAEPGSPVWREAMAQLQVELPNHARGEYGAKIARASGPVGPLSGAEFSSLVEQFFSRANDQAARGAIHKQLHEGVIPAPQGCLPCHRGEPPLLDFAALGYAPARIQALKSTPVAEIMQQIREGQPFNLPLAP